MKSIRRSLFRRLFAGLAVVSVLAGISLYLLLRTGLQARFDADLGHLASSAPLALLPTDSGHTPALQSRRWEPFFQPNSGFYLQIWSADGTVRVRSRSLGDRQLPHPPDLGAQPRYWNLVMADGERLRATAGRVDLPSARAGTEGAPLRMDVIVARNRADLDRVLTRLMAGIAGGALLVALGLALLVRLAVGRGLQPLRRVAEQAAAIQADRLTERFDVQGAPEELRPIVDRLNDLMARLEAAFERERRFSADLAHELRTPVAELRTAAEVALRWPGGSHEDNYREVLEISGQMQTILESLLTLARSGPSALPAATEALSVAKAVADCWRPFARRAEEKRLTVEHEIPADQTVVTHPGMFRLILSNLFSNATEYTPEGGRIRVECRPAPSGGVELLAANSVSGLRPQDIPHLFERFWRRDEARTGGRHHGLGLCVAKSCADAIACDLTAELNDRQDLLTFHLRPRGKVTEPGTQQL